MHDHAMLDARRVHAHACPLCAYTGSEHDVFDEIMSYVADNAHRVHLDELITHVRTALLEQLQIDMGRDHIREHFLSHQCEQKIVLNAVLRDLIDIIGVAKSNCIVTSEEGMQSMDPKNTGVYIDAVKQLMSIYKQLEQTGRKS
jgi:hypothetical protein